MNEPSEPVVSLEVLRAALRMAIEQSSLRKVAREVGISPRGLARAIEVTEPRKTTIARFRDWYALHAPSVSDDVAGVSLANLLEGLNGTDRAYAADMVLAVIEAVHRRRQRRPPGWIEALRRRRV